VVESHWVELLTKSGTPPEGRRTGGGNAVTVRSRLPKIKLEGEKEVGACKKNLPTQNNYS